MSVTLSKSSKSSKSVSLKKYAPKHAVGSFRSCCPKGNLWAEMTSAEHILRGMSAADLVGRMPGRHSLERPNTVRPA